MAKNAEFWRVLQTVSVVLLVCQLLVLRSEAQSFFRRSVDDLDKAQLELLRNAFNAFDQEKKGCIGTQMVGTILSMLGHQLDDKMLKEIIDEVDADGSGELEFEEFVTLAARFMVEEDAEAMQQELKEAFRLYDKEGNGYITTQVLREILKELDDNLSNEDLDMMIEEIDSDGSGTVDFDEFMEVMTGGDD
ncbi:troponin C, isoallergen Bla g 6.0101-like isoform X1 [Anopheles aquasalis]|nr:troponin C, isoallergen Bla g 6.0101-like isoform X1 [Anopheles aquasalis]